MSTGGLNKCWHHALWREDDGEAGPLALGTFEAGFANIQVKAFAANGALAGEATTDGAGNYSIATTLDGPYRVELGTLPNGLYDSAQGATSATSVRFVAAGGDSNLNFGVTYPAAYCEDSPNIVTNLFYQDNAVSDQSSSAENAVTGFPYSSIDNVYVKRTLTIQQQQVGIRECQLSQR